VISWQGRLSRYSSRVENMDLTRLAKRLDLPQGVVEEIYADKLQAYRKLPEIIREKKALLATRNLLLRRLTFAATMFWGFFFILTDNIGREFFKTLKNKPTMVVKNSC